MLGFFRVFSRKKCHGAKRSMAVSRNRFRYPSGEGFLLRGDFPFHERDVRRQSSHIAKRPDGGQLAQSRVSDRSTSESSQLYVPTLPSVLRTIIASCTWSEEGLFKGFNNILFGDGLFKRWAESPDYEVSGDATW